VRLSRLAAAAAHAAGNPINAAVATDKDVTLPTASRAKPVPYRQ